MFYLPLFPNHGGSFKWTGTLRLDNADGDGDGDGDGNENVKKSNVLN